MYSFNSIVNIILKEEELSRLDKIKALKRLGPFVKLSTNRFKGLSWDEVEGTIVESYHYERVLDGYDYYQEPIYRTAFIFKLLTEDQEEVYGQVVFRGDYDRITDAWDTESVEELSFEMYQRLIDEVNR